MVGLLEFTQTSHQPCRYQNEHVRRNGFCKEHYLNVCLLRKGNFYIHSTASTNILCHGRSFISRKNLFVQGIRSWRPRRRGRWSQYFLTKPASFAEGELRIADTHRRPDFHT